MVKTLANPTIGILADKKFGELCNVLVCCRNVDMITLKVGEKNFGEFLPIRQIRQSFLRQVFLPYSTYFILITFLNLLDLEYRSTNTAYLSWLVVNLIKQ